jgi:hypothetical protein
VAGAACHEKDPIHTDLVQRPVLLRLPIILDTIKNLFLKQAA